MVGEWRIIVNGYIIKTLILQEKKSHGINRIGSRYRLRLKSVRTSDQMIPKRPNIGRKDSCPLECHCYDQ